MRTCQTLFALHDKTIAECSIEECIAQRTITSMAGNREQWEITKVESQMFGHKIFAEEVVCLSDDSIYLNILRQIV